MVGGQLQKVKLSSTVNDTMNHDYRSGFAWHKILKIPQLPVCPLLIQGCDSNQCIFCLDHQPSRKKCLISASRIRQLNCNNVFNFPVLQVHRRKSCEQCFAARRKLRFLSIGNKQHSFGKDPWQLSKLMCKHE